MTKNTHDKQQLDFKKSTFDSRDIVSVYNYAIIMYQSKVDAILIIF